MVGLGDSSTVAIRLGDGDGTLQSTATYATGIGSQSVAVADLSGDGKLDLAVAHSAGASVQIGNGDGTLQLRSDYDDHTNAVFDVAIGDLNGDNRPDLVTAIPSIGAVSGTVVTLVHSLQAATCTMQGSHFNDFDDDGKDDILLRNSDGTPAVWLLNGTSLATAGAPLPNLGISWHAKASRDFNNDGYSDILWQRDDETAAVWLMNGTGVQTMGAPLPNPGAAWQVHGAGDFDGNGKADILWQDEDGSVAVWRAAPQSGPFLACPGLRGFQR